MTAMKSVLWAIVLALLIASCKREDSDYKTGMYYLNERDNWQSATHSFERSLANNPNRWKTHLAMIEALSRGDSPERLEAQLKSTLERFPDSTRSVVLTTTASQLLGEDRTTQLAGSIEVDRIEELLASKGPEADLLARAVIAGCRARDSVAVNVHLQELLTVLKGGVPDSVRSELYFFIGLAKLEKFRLAARLSSFPDDYGAHLEFARSSIQTWDMGTARKEIGKIAKFAPELLKDQKQARGISALYGILPFSDRIVTIGRDACREPFSGNLTIFVRDLGKPGEPDPYFFRISGGGETHMMKALQQNLRFIALPRLSPNSDWVYFYGSNDKNWSPGKIGRFNLYRIRPTYGAVPEKLTDDDLIFCAPVVEPDGSILLVRRDVGSVRQSAEVFRLNPNTKKSDSIVRIAEPVAWAAFTPGRDTLLFITGKGVFRRGLQGGVTVYEMPAQGLSYPLLSPDGRYLLAQGPNSEQLLFDRDTGEAIYLGQASAPMGWFGSNGQLLVSRKLGGESKVIELDLTKPLDIADRLLSAASDESTQLETK